MLEPLAFALRHVLDAALVVATVRAALRRAHRTELLRATSHALALSLVVSVLGALVLEVLVSVPDQVLAAGLSLLALAATWAALRFIGRGSLAAGDDCPRGVPDLAGAWSLGLIVLGVAGVAGARLVAFGLDHAAPGPWLTLARHALLGLWLAVLLGLVLARFLERLEPSGHALASRVLLGAVLAAHALQAWRALAEIGRLPANPSSMAVGTLVLHAGAFELLAIAFSIVVLGAPVAARTRGVALLFVAILGALLVAPEIARDRRLAEREARGADRPRRTAFDSGALRLPLAGLESDRGHLFEVDLDGRSVRVLVWIDGKRPRVCLDECESCGPAGHVAVGRRVTCLNCGAEFPPAGLGVRGGCRPIPLPYTVAAATLTISRDAIEEALPRSSRGKIGE